MGHHTRGARPNPVVTVGSAMLTALVVIVFARLAYGLILPAMREGLGLTYQQAGNLGTVTALGYLLFVLPGGLAATRWGSRRTVLVGLVVVTLGFCGLAIASAYPLIVVLMLLLGIGTAYCFAPMLSLLVAWYPERRGLVIGFMTAGIGAGIFVAGLLVPWLTSIFGANGWRVAWAVFAATAVLIFVLVLVGVPDPPDFGSERGRTLSSPEKWRIYRSHRILVTAVVYGIIGMAYIIQGLFMISFAEASGISSDTAGWLLSMSGLLSVICGPLWGLLSDVWGRANALLLALAVVTAGMALPLASQSLPTFFCHFFLIGCAVNGAFTMIQAASTDQVAPRYVPIAFSYVTVFFAFGQFLGPAVAGWLIEISGFRSAVAFTCGVLLLGLYLGNQIRHFPRGLAIE